MANDWSIQVPIAWIVIVQDVLPNHWGRARLPLSWANLLHPARWIEEFEQESHSTCCSFRGFAAWKMSISGEAAFWVSGRNCFAHPLLTHHHSLAIRFLYHQLIQFIVTFPRGPSMLPFSPSATHSSPCLYNLEAKRRQCGKLRKAGWLFVASLLSSIFLFSGTLVMQGKEMYDAFKVAAFIWYLTPFNSC